MVFQEIATIGFHWWLIWLNSPEEKMKQFLYFEPAIGTVTDGTLVAPTHCGRADATPAVFFQQERFWRHNQPNDHIALDVRKRDGSKYLVGLVLPEYLHGRALSIGSLAFDCNNFDMPSITLTQYQQSLGRLSTEDEAYQATANIVREQIAKAQQLTRILMT
jgi:hypothetical protein